MAIPLGKETKILSIENIYDYVTEEDILLFYFDIDTLPKIVNSPLRKENNPSFEFHYSESGRIYFYDYGSLENGGLFDLLMKIYNLSFQEVIEKVYAEMIEGKDRQKIEYKYDKKNVKTKSKIEQIQVKIRNWRHYDEEFWLKYGISKEWCSFGDIYPITHIFIKKDNRDIIVPAEKYAYAYLELKDGKPTYKIYQPYSENYKWMNHHDKSVWDLWSKLPESGDKLIITSSRKDALCVWANTGIPTTSLQAESYYPKENVINQLKKRFKIIYLLYDNDFESETNWGRVNGEKLSKEFNLIQIEIPDEYKSKDPSDLFKNHGKEVFSNVFSNLIK